MADDKRIKAVPKAGTFLAKAEPSTVASKNKEEVVAEVSAPVKPEPAKTTAKVPAKRGRKPNAVKAAAAAAAIEDKPVVKRGRKPNAVKAAAAAIEDKPVVKRGRKPNAAKAAVVKKPAAKTAVKPAAEAPAPRGRRKVAEVVDRTDVVKTALWKAINKTKAKKIKDDVAIQIFADGLESFYIAVKGGQPEIERYYYNNNNGQMVTSEEELLKIAKGNYDIVKAAKIDKVNFDGSLSVFLKIIDLF